MHTISSVLSTVERGDYVFKIDLQDAYFHVLIHLDSRKYIHFAFENKAYLWSNTAPQVFTRLGHTVAVYLHRQGILVIPYLDDWLIHHPDRQVLLHHQSQVLHILKMVGLKLNEGKSEGYPVSGALVTLGSGESFPPNIQGSGDNKTCVTNILPENFVVHKSAQFMGSLNWASGLIQLGRLHNIFIH